MKKWMGICLVLASVLVLSACTEKPDALAAGDETAHQDKIPMVMVDGTLYYDTNRESSLGARCGVMDGEITSAVDGTEIPEENDQSNFGTGYGYQYGLEGSIELNIDGKWMVFEERSGDGSTVLYEGKSYYVDDLSEETVKWLTWYNGLSKKEQLTVNHVPAELMEEEGKIQTEDAVFDEEKNVIK